MYLTAHRFFSSFFYAYLVHSGTEIGTTNSVLKGVPLSGYSGKVNVSSTEKIRALKERNIPNSGCQTQGEKTSKSIVSGIKFCLFRKINARTIIRRAHVKGKVFRSTNARINRVPDIAGCPLYNPLCILPQVPRTPWKDSSMQSR